VVFLIALQVEKELLRKTADGSLAVWNASVNDSLCTLKEAFHGVSRVIGFNIELKFDDYNPIPHWDLKAAIQSVLEV
jgi:glycerophosphodiester phosphodiesterase